MNHRTWSMLAVTATLLAPVPVLAAYRCPAADPTATGDNPTLSADDLAGSDVSDALKTVIHRMLVDGMKSGDIVDRLVAADCRRIDAEPNVSDDGKADQVRRFASKIANLVYSTPGKSEEDIVVKVPVPTSVFEHLRQAADKAGVSQDAWVNAAIDDKLGKP